MIDPKGVMGPAIYDVGRFLLNEIDCATEEEKRSISQKPFRFWERSYPFQILYIEAWLACVWELEDSDSPGIFEQSFALAQRLYKENGLTTGQFKLPLG